MQKTARPRWFWLTLEGSEIIEMKQIVLDRDIPGAKAFFRRVVIPQIREEGRDAAQRRGIPLDVVEEGRDDGCLSG